jgi:hypothetical protein
MVAAFKASWWETVEGNRAMIIEAHDRNDAGDDDLNRTLAKMDENFAMLVGALHELKAQIERLGVPLLQRPLIEVPPFP